MAFSRIQLALWMLSDRHEYARIPHTIGFRGDGESTFPANQLRLIEERPARRSNDASGNDGLKMGLRFRPRSHFPLFHLCSDKTRQARWLHRFQRETSYTQCVTSIHLRLTHLAARIAITLAVQRNKEAILRCG